MPMAYSDFIDTLDELHIKKKGKRPKMSANRFYPARVDLQTQELIREELNNYAYKLQNAAQKGGVQAVYDVPGAVPEGFEEKAAQVANEVSLFQVRAFSNFSEMAVGERYFPNQGDKETILATWTDNFVNLCKSTNEEMRKKVAGVVSDGVLGGRNIRDLTKDIQNTCRDFTRNKAELIATTEVGKLNTAIARNQSESAGIQFYEWAAAMDGRTRESHAVMDGKICKWGDDTHYYVWSEPDPKTGKKKLVRRDRPENAYKGAPGTDFRCRCVALPYVPEFEDDYEAEREKGPVRGVAQGEHASLETIENPDVIKREKSIQKSISRSFAVINERLKDLPKEKRPSYIPYEPDNSIWVDSKRLAKYNESLLSKKRHTEGDEKNKFEKEMAIARNLREIGLGSILVEENGIYGKSQPDAIVDGKVAEFKQVDGGVGRVADRVKDALHQGATLICLNIMKNLPLDAVMDRIKSRTKNHKGVEVIFRLGGKNYRYREE